MQLLEGLVASSPPSDWIGSTVSGTVDGLLDNTLNTSGMTASVTSAPFTPSGGWQDFNFVFENGIQVTNGSVVTAGLAAVFNTSDFNSQLKLHDPNGAIGDYGGFLSYNNPFSGETKQVIMDNGTAPIFSSETPVPGPLPVLGLPAVLLYSRKLKKRIKGKQRAGIGTNA